MADQTMKRGQFVGKFSLLLAGYVIVVIGIEALMRLSVQKQSVSTVLAESYSFALFLTPNTLSFAVSSFIMRRRWVELRLPQILVVAAFAAVLTVVSLFVLAFVLGLVYYSVSENGAEMIIRTIMVAPGILAAQLLRAGAKTRSAHVAI